MGLLYCPICDDVQIETPSGMTCVNGHGGEEGILRDAPPELHLDPEALDKAILSICTQRMSDAAPFTVAETAVIAYLKAAGLGGWQPSNKMPHELMDGRHVLLWVCTRNSIRRGKPILCRWAFVPDVRDHAWTYNNGKDWLGADAPLFMEVPLPAGARGE